ncbi:hypothetical protein FSOLCH5_014500 [Fusarium solani]
MNRWSLDTSEGGMRARVFPAPVADTSLGSSWAHPMPMDDTGFGLSRSSRLAGLTGRGGESSTSTTSSYGPGSAGVFDLARRWDRKGLAKPHRPQ